MNKLLTVFAAIFMALTVMVAAPQPAFAACVNNNTSKGQVIEGIGQTGGNCSDSGVTSVIKAAVEILSIVIGFAAVIMVLVSGFKYITSGGDSGKVSSAKSTLVYALVGVAVAALAQTLIHFVLSTSDKAVTPCPSNSSISAADSRCK